MKEVHLEESESKLISFSGERKQIRITIVFVRKYNLGVCVKFFWVITL